MRKFTLVGGGLAGLSLVESLLSEGAEPGQIRLIDAEHPTRGSDNPTAMFHPFPGRSLEPEPRRMRLVEGTLRRIAHWRQRFDDPPIVESTMIRPLGNNHLADKLLESWQGEANYPDWFTGSLLEGRSLHEYGEHLQAFDAGFVYRPAFAIDLDTLTDQLAARFADRGVAIDRPATVERLHHADGGWRLELDDGTRHTERVVLALGPALEDWFDGLAMRSRGGELIHFPKLDASRLDHILNSGGHVAPHPDGGIVAGASWFDPDLFQARTAREAVDAIVERCEPLYPRVGEAEMRVVWRGVRAIFGDHQPLVGPIPGLPGLDVFGAFGSKGLLRIPLHAEQFARALFDKSSDVPELSAASRLNDDKWHPSSQRISTHSANP